MRSSTGILAALMMGMAMSMNQHRPPPSFGLSRSGSHNTFVTRSGGKMQCQGVKKPRNRKGRRK